MNFLKKLFNTTLKNEIHKLERVIAEKTTEIMTLQELKGLAFNPDNHMSFIVADICFHLDNNLSDIELAPEYIEFISEEKSKEPFKIIYKYLDHYYKGDPDLNKALWNLTSAYLVLVWKAPKSIVTNPISLTTYSMHLAKIRGYLKEQIDSALIEKIKASNNGYSS